MDTSTIPAVDTRLSLRDRLGRWRVRWSIGRGSYRVEPGLYRIGRPGPESPVLVTANYKLTFDALRSELDGVDGWILVLETQGVNVWCAAGKGTFGTDELVHRIAATHLAEVVSHRKLVVPQLGATGVAAHEVKRRCGFRVVYGPIRAADLRAFLANRMRASEQMRRVTFGLRERLELVGVEVVGALKWILPGLLVVLLLAGSRSALGALGAALPVLTGALAGSVLVPILLPWIPGRAFSLKGALVGAVAVGAAIALTPGDYPLLGSVQLFLFGTAASSFFAMQFTGATTFTSPSGVEWEMKKALPFQLGAIVVATAIGLWRLVVG
ncbi:MAG: hypothetical protein GY769_04810 [bacterium]|nr:hypothetical protein [bacterium]